MGAFPLPSRRRHHVRLRSHILHQRLHYSCATRKPFALRSDDNQECRSKDGRGGFQRLARIRTSSGLCCCLVWIPQGVMLPHLPFFVHESIAAVSTSPFLESLKQKRTEVMYS